MITPSSLAIILQGAPFPDAVFTVTPGGAALDLTIGDETITFCEGAWFAAERRATPAHLSFAATPTAEQVHTEIRRVLAVLAAEPSPTWAQIKADCVGPELSTKIARMSPGHLGGDLLAHPFPGAVDLRLTTEGLHFTVGDVTLRYDGEAFHAPRYRIESTLPHPAAINAQGVHAEIHRVLAIVMGARMPDAEQALAKVTAERDQARQAYLDLSTNNPLRPTVNAIAERLGVCPAEPGPLLAEIDRIKGLADAHTVVSQRLVGSQKEVAEVSAERDEATARADRLAAQNAAAHEVIDDARCVPRSSALGLPLSLFDRLLAVMQYHRRDDKLREQIAVAVGLDGSASLALILDTVKSADTTKDTDLAHLVAYHQAPIKFNTRPLTLAERASFVIRRLWQGRTNATNEAAALRRELGDIADALGDLPDTAEREPIGDREEHLGLSTAERIRLSR